MAQDALLKAMNLAHSELIEARLQAFKTNLPKHFGHSHSRGHRAFELFFLTENCESSGGDGVSLSTSSSAANKTWEASLEVALRNARQLKHFPGALCVERSARRSDQ